MKQEKESIEFTEAEKKLVFNAVTAHQESLNSLVKKEQALNQFKAAEKTLETSRVLEEIKSRLL